MIGLTRWRGKRRGNPHEKNVPSPPGRLGKTCLDGIQAVKSGWASKEVSAPGAIAFDGETFQGHARRVGTLGDVLGQFHRDLHGLRIALIRGPQQIMARFVSQLTVRAFAMLSGDKKEPRRRVK
jgi:hypothetical protein